MVRGRNQSASSSPWLKGLFVDVLIGAGGWSLPLIIGALFLANNYYGVLSLGFYFLALFCNNPHYMATIHRAYGVKRDFNKYKFFSIYISAIIAVSGILAHVSPGLVPVLFTVYLVWSPWHYTGQNFGISMMMLRRSGIALSKKQRSSLYISYIASYVVWIVDLNVHNSEDALTLSFAIPDQVSLVLRALGYVVFFVFGIAGLFALKKGQAFKTVIFPAVLLFSQFLWFLLPGVLRDLLNQDFPATYFNAGILAFMHCAQYLWVTSYYTKNETEQGLRGINKSWNPLRYFGALFLGGVVLFVPGPWFVSVIFGHDLFESALIFIALVNIHHFMLDGAIWKLRDGRIARLLLGSSSQVRHDVNECECEGTWPPILNWVLGKGALARLVRYSLIVCLVAFAALDQIQNIFTSKGATGESVEIAEMLNPNDSRVYFRRAQLNLANGDYSTAVDELKAVLDLNPRNVAALHSLAQLRLTLGEIEEAKVSYSRILELVPRDLSALRNLGIIAIHNQNWAIAEEYFQKSYAEEPDSWENRCFLGQALTELRNYDEAIPLLESTLPSVSEIKDFSGLPRLRLVVPHLADCYEATGRIQEATAIRVLLMSE